MDVLKIVTNKIAKLRSRSSAPLFMTENVKIGPGTEIGRNVTFNCKDVVIGDGVQIGDGVVFNCESLRIGDFASLYPNSFFPGPGSISIGHNFWLGCNCIVDCQGGTTISDNVGVGAHSQLWTHMKFGDLAAGCRFHSSSPLVIDKDVWLVGHVLVSPVHIGARSLVMLGSLVTTNIPTDKVFAGSPAKDMTDKFGSQFRETTVQERISFVASRIEIIAARNNIKDVWSRVQLIGHVSENNHNCELCINVAERSYSKRQTKFERLVIRALLPDAKFTPVD